MAKTNQDIEMAMGTADNNNPSNALLSVIHQAAKDMVGKEVQHLKHHIRKTLQATAKNRRRCLMPKKSGREPSNSSKSLSANSKRKSRKDSSEGKGKQQETLKSAMRKSIKFK